MRIRAIDTFRGLSIVLMVFFSLLARLSNELPDVLVHNRSFSLHLGDFVLPMFLFASGMSLVYFVKKRKKGTKQAYTLDIIERFGKLVIISFFLTPFSAGEFLGMDEVMLNAVLFIPAVILIGFSEMTIAAVGVGILVAYLSLQQLMLLPDFSGHYLGGYPAAVFYLPVMLAGIIAGKRMDKTGKLLLGAVVVALLLLALTPPYKMSASPSFMMLSVVFSLAVFAISRNLKIGQLDYLGRNPIRYWVLMFVVFIIPLTFYVAYTGEEPPKFSLDWMTALVLSVISTILLYFVSKIINLLQDRVMKRRALS